MGLKRNDNVNFKGKFHYKFPSEAHFFEKFTENTDLSDQRFSEKMETMEGNVGFNCGSEK